MSTEEQVEALRAEQKQIEAKTGFEWRPVWLAARHDEIEREIEKLEKED